MKKSIYLLVAFLILIQTSTAYAASSEGKYPKLIVEEYTLEQSSLTPGDETTVTIKIRNTSSTKSAKNIRLSFKDAANEILPIKTASTVYPFIGTGDVAEWKIDVFAIEAAKDAPHLLSIKMEYEDKQGNNLTSEDTITIEVVQPVRMKYSEPELPVRVTQGDTLPLSITLMNMGKGDLYNALLSYDIQGLANGGSVLVGTILSGASKDGETNLRVDSEVTGDVTGKITLSYEDSRGKYYEEALPVSTFIEEKAVYASADVAVDTKSNEYPWKSLAIFFGCVSVLLLTVSLVTVSKSRKIRKEYELKL